MTMKNFHLHDHRQGWRFWRPTREGDCQLPSVKEHVIPGKNAEFHLKLKKFMSLNKRSEMRIWPSIKQ